MQYTILGVVFRCGFVGVRLPYNSQFCTEGVWQVVTFIVPNSIHNLWQCVLRRPDSCTAQLGNIRCKAATQQFRPKLHNTAEVHCHIECCNRSSLPAICSVAKPAYMVETAHIVWSCAAFWTDRLHTTTHRGGGGQHVGYNNIFHMLPNSYFPCLFSISPAYFSSPLPISHVALL